MDFMVSDFSVTSLYLLHLLTYYNYALLRGCALTLLKTFKFVTVLNIQLACTAIEYCNIEFCTLAFINKYFDILGSNVNARNSNEVVLLISNQITGQIVTAKL